MTGDELSRAIRNVCAGDHLRAAVAFWGAGVAAELLSRHTAKAQIVCNLTIGGTNPNALIELGAPQNRNVRWAEMLHAKVFISDAGCVVTSANATDNGVGWGQEAHWTEAGCFFEPGEGSYLEATSWFEKLFADAAIVDAEALALCESHWRRNPSNAARLTETGEHPGLFSMMRSNPEAFSGFGVVVTTTMASHMDVLDDIVALVPAPEREAIRILYRNQNVYSTYDWGEPAGEWPQRWISLHRNGRRGRRRVHLQTRVSEFGDNQLVFGAYQKQRLAGIVFEGGQGLTLSSADEKVFDNLLGPQSPLRIDDDDIGGIFLTVDDFVEKALNRLP